MAMIRFLLTSGTCVHLTDATTPHCSLTYYGLRLTVSPSYGQTVEYGLPIPPAGGSYGYQIGKDGVSAKYSPSAVLGEIGVKALNRLIDDSKPFALTVNFNAPVRDGRFRFTAFPHVTLTLLLVTATARTVHKPR
jgi:hypothetical protein